MLANDRTEKREALDSSLFHKLSGGDPESFVSQVFVLLDEVLQKQRQMRVSGANGNGVSPGRDDVASKKDIQRLEQAIQKLREIPSTNRSAHTEHWASQWAKLVGGGLILIGLGYLLCWAVLHSELEAQIAHDLRISDERVMRVISAKPADYRTFLEFVSFGGSMTREPIAQAPGHPETEGFVIQSGHLIKPCLSDDKAVAIVPIPLKR